VAENSLDWGERGTIPAGDSRKAKCGVRRLLSPEVHFNHSVPAAASYTEYIRRVVMRVEPPYLSFVAGPLMAACTVLWAATGADVCVAQTGKLGLLEACSKGDLKKVERLLREGADVNSRDKYDRTALIRVCMGLPRPRDSNDPLPGLVRLLLNRGADPNIRDKYGKTALIWASSLMPSKWASSEPVLQVLRLLLDKGADINAKDKEGKTPLMYAVFPDVARLLVEKGAKINAGDGTGRTALMWCAGGSWHQYVGYVETMDLLLEKGAQINDQDKEGKTALIWACSEGTLLAIKLLLQKGADTNVRDNKGKTALVYFKSRKTEFLPQIETTVKDVMDLFLKRGAKE